MDQTIGRLYFMLLTMLWSRSEHLAFGRHRLHCSYCTPAQAGIMALVTCLLATWNTTEHVLLHLRHLQMGGRSQKHPCSEHSQTDSPAQVACVLVAQLNRTVSPTFCLCGSCCVHHRWTNSRKAQMRPLMATSAVNVNFCGGTTTVRQSSM